MVATRRGGSGLPLGHSIKIGGSAVLKMRAAAGIGGRRNRLTGRLIGGPQRKKAPRDYREGKEYPQPFAISEPGVDPPWLRSLALFHEPLLSSFCSINSGEFLLESSECSEDCIAARGIRGIPT
jgi:hypothetical protein